MTAAARRDVSTDHAAVDSHSQYDDDGGNHRPIMEKMIDEAIVARRDAGTEEGWRWSRFLHAIKARLLVGTGIEVHSYSSGIVPSRLSIALPVGIGACERLCVAAAGEVLLQVLLLLESQRADVALVFEFPSEKLDVVRVDCWPRRPQGLAQGSPQRMLSCLQPP